MRTELTEITTGVAMMGSETLGEAYGSERPPPELRNVDEQKWTALKEAIHTREYEAEFLAAFNNGRSFLKAVDGLNGRIPRIVEWRGPHRDPAESAVPADLRVDHVYLVSCKYLSKVLTNASPWSLFDRCLQGAQGSRGPGDWYSEVAPAEHQNLYSAVKRQVIDGGLLPEKVGDLSTNERRQIAHDTARDSSQVTQAYADLIEGVSIRSAQRWQDHLRSSRDQELMLWRLLRLSATPYFVLGTGAGESLRLRVATPWDWRQEYQLAHFEVTAEGGGQPRVGWSATVLKTAKASNITTESEQLVQGHVEIRWSHGRFGGHPEAKIYIDTPHSKVAGYYPIK